MRLTALKVGLIADFAAIQALLSVLPFTITIGVSGQITLGVIGGPLIGILLEPFSAGLAVLIGSFVGIFLNPSGAFMSWFTVIPPTIGALATAFTRLRRGYVAGMMILVSLLVFYANPIGQEVFVITWFHIFGMIVAFSSVLYVKKTTFSSVGNFRPAFAIAVAALVGLLADSMAGNATAMWYFWGTSPLQPPVWYAIMFVYPFERIVALLLAVGIALPVYFSIKRSGMARQLE